LLQNENIIILTLKFAITHTKTHAKGIVKKQ
jgi:hypothetical protein